MPTKKPLRYRDAGVDIDEADRAVASIKKFARNTFTRGVLTDIGSFGAAFQLSGMRKPVLVSSADGVGTKLKVAFLTGIHHTVGEDLVNHCVNDIAVQGALPLFFLDYFAVGKLDAEVAASVVSGIARGCRANGCALIGGETAEMPGMYPAGEYDLAGFIVGAAERRELVTGAGIRAGDVLLGLPSNGLHTNGYSLARRIAFETLGLHVDSHVDELGETVGAALLKTHRSYLRAIAPLLDRRLIKGMAHITGGGITENLPRTLPDGLTFALDRRSWQIPPLFAWLQRAGQVDDAEMFRAFNMGVGLILVCSPQSTPEILSALHPSGAWVLGEVRGPTSPAGTPA